GLHIVVEDARENDEPLEALRALNETQELSLVCLLLSAGPVDRKIFELDSVQRRGDVQLIRHRVAVGAAVFVEENSEASRLHQEVFVLHPPKGSSCRRGRRRFVGPIPTPQQVQNPEPPQLPQAARRPLSPSSAPITADAVRQQGAQNMRRFWFSVGRLDSGEEGAAQSGAPWGDDVHDTMGDSTSPARHYADAPD